MLLLKRCHSNDFSIFAAFLSISRLFFQAVCQANGSQYELMLTGRPLRRAVCVLLLFLKI